jgi:hypothetical protein
MNRKKLKPQPHPPERPVLRFSPLAYLKLQLFLHAGECEIGGFGISSEEDLLYIEEFVSLKQHSSLASVELEDSAVADYFDACIDRGLSPQRFGRIWIHTHPGASAAPSLTDEETFARVFGRCDWSVLFIHSRGAERYARLAFASGPGGSLPLQVAVDWERWPAILLEEGPRLAALFEAWMDEYGANIHPAHVGPLSSAIRIPLEDWLDQPLDELEASSEALFMEMGHDY